MLADDKFAEYLSEFTMPIATADSIVKPWRGKVECDLKWSKSRSAALDPRSYAEEIFAINSRIFHYPDELAGGTDTHDPIPKSQLGLSQQEKEVRNDKAKIILARCSIPYGVASTDVILAGNDPGDFGQG